MGSRDLDSEYLVQGYPPYPDNPEGPARHHHPHRREPEVQPPGCAPIPPYPYVHPPAVMEVNHLKGPAVLLTADHIPMSHRHSSVEQVMHVLDSRTSRVVGDVAGLVRDVADLKTKTHKNEHYIHHIVDDIKVLKSVTGFLSDDMATLNTVVADQGRRIDGLESTVNIMQSSINIISIEQGLQRDQISNLITQVNNIEDNIEIIVTNTVEQVVADMVIVAAQI